ncbi:MAG: hypothetical protein JF591_23435 [Lysobacter sp.]|nr:hypothetical protein [Lysobacter sp.]
MLKPLTAAISSVLLLSTFAGTSYAQDADPAATPASDKAAVDLDNVVVTGTRSPKAVDKIPGAITLVSKAELARSLVLTEDATAVLARTVPGYAESSQAMSNTGENLRGRVALRLFDGVPQGRRPDRSHQRPVCVGRHRRGRRHHQLPVRGADQGRQRVHHHLALHHPVQGRQRRLEARRDLRAQGRQLRHDRRRLVP